MSGEKRKVLVFEDNASIQTLLRFFFQKRGLELRLEPDGVEAVKAAREFSPDLIVMDYIMPGKDGVEAAADLRAAGVTTPILMLTSKAFDADKARAQAAGVDAYLIKPFDPSQLEAAYSSLLKP
jgi:DNA-binding response OmpR family regulator